MNAEEKERLIIALQDHVNNITNLRYGSYVLADSLAQRTKRHAVKYFPDRLLFLDEINKINFELPEQRENHGVNSWNESYRTLLTVSQAMLDEVQQPSEHASITAPSINKIQKLADVQEKKLYATSFLIIASSLLWTFNEIVKWSWLTFHPKRIAIYLSIQVAIIFISTLFFTNNRQVRFVEWLSIAVAIVLAVISLLY
jgi:hypothetical protein